MASPATIVASNARRGARAVRLAELVDAVHAVDVPHGWGTISTGNFDPDNLSLPKPAEGINQLQSELTTNLRDRIHSETAAAASRKAAYPSPSAPPHRSKVSRACLTA